MNGPIIKTVHGRNEKHLRYLTDLACEVQQFCYLIEEGEAFDMPFRDKVYDNVTKALGMNIYNFQVAVESSVSSDKYVDRDKVMTNFVTKTNVDIEKIKEVEVKKIKRSRPVHHVTFEFMQSSFTLNIAQHIRNAANAFDFTVPVTEEFYNSVSKGQELQSKFKTASFILGGHIGSRKVYVKDRFIKYVEER